MLLDILNKTKSNELTWYNHIGQNCCYTTHDNSVYIISKYVLPNGMCEISFNKCDKWGFIIKPFKEYSDTHQDFNTLSKIYDLAWISKCEE